MFFQWAQLKDGISTRWKRLMFDYSDNNKNEQCTKKEVFH